MIASSKSMPALHWASDKAVETADEICSRGDWPDQTPEATPHRWYDFFVPSCIQEIVKQRLKQFETAKLVFRLFSDPDCTKTRKEVLEKLLSDMEVMRIPCLGVERRGSASIGELRDYIFANMSGLSIQMVDIVPDDTDGRAFSMRLIVKVTQLKPVFPHLPVNVPVALGMQLSVRLNDAWRPQATCWNFIPIEPLLDIAKIQDLAQVIDTTPPPPAPYSSDENSPPSSPSCGSDNDMSDMQLEAHKTRLLMEHKLGVCVPCSFNAFRSDGCRHGDACEFCHHCTASEAKARRKQRRKHANKESTA
jgi:hypothetical protein